MKRDELIRFRELARPYLDDPRYCRMKQFTQHGQVTTYEHCVRVAQTSYLLAHKIHLRVNERALVTGALLHDYYLYDWHEAGDGSHKLHGFSHPARALKNAQADFGIGDEEAEIIGSHMWPLTLRRPPRTREAAVVCLVDKICSLQETLLKRRSSKT